MKHKKSDLWSIDYMVWAGILGIMVGFAAIFFVILIGKTGSEQAEVSSNIEAFLLKQRFYKSSECFVSSENLRGIIDIAKFNSQNMNKCYSIIDKTMPAFRLTMNSDGINQLQIKTDNWDENKQFQDKEIKQILLYSGGEIKIGEMIIETQNFQ